MSSNGGREVPERPPRSPGPLPARTTYWEDRASLARAALKTTSSKRECGCISFTPPSCPTPPPPPSLVWSKYDEFREKHRCFDMALFCMSRDHWLRKFCTRLLTAQAKSVCTTVATPTQAVAHCCFLFHCFSWTQASPQRSCGDSVDQQDQSCTAAWPATIHIHSQVRIRSTIVSSPLTCGPSHHAERCSAHSLTSHGWCLEV